MAATASPDELTAQTERFGWSPAPSEEVRCARRDLALGQASGMVRWLQQLLDGLRAKAQASEADWQPEDFATVTYPNVTDSGIGHIIREGCSCKNEIIALLAGSRHSTPYHGSWWAGRVVDTLKEALTANCGLEHLANCLRWKLHDANSGRRG
jgi:hypothetical protein